jgi:hypothetical protein
MEYLDPNLCKMCQTWPENQKHQLCHICEIRCFTTPENPIDDNLHVQYIADDYGRGFIQYQYRKNMDDYIGYIEIFPTNPDIFVTFFASQFDELDHIKYANQLWES